jgi:hypothetical protein
LPSFCAEVNRHLSHGDCGEQTPEFITAVRRKFAPAGTFTEALEDAEGNVLLIPGAPVPFAEPLAGEGGEAPEIALPECLRSRFIALP